MPNKLEEYIEQAQDLIEDNKDRNEKYEWMDKADNVAWEPDAKLMKLQWFRPLPSHALHDALNAGARALSTLLPKPSVCPMDSSPSARDRASTIEKVLMWNYRRATTRSEGNLTFDLVYDCLKYHDASAQVIYLPWERKLTGASKPKLWNPGGDFMVIRHAPSTVYATRSAEGLESVLLHKTVCAKDVINRWGDFAKKIKKKYDDGEIDEVSLYDFTDADRRVVWVYLDEEDHVGEDKGAIEIYNDKWDLPFINWISRKGGRPLLDPVYNSGAWEITNLVRSLRISNIVAMSAFPKSKTVTIDGEQPDFNYETPGGNVPLRPGESFESTQPPPFDPMLNTIDNELEMSMGSSTVPKILQDPNVPSGAAFASINTVLRQASTVLDPYKKLGELLFADAYTQMLYWSIHSKEDLIAYDVTQKNAEGYGSQIRVKAEELDPESIYITSKLTASLPIDEVAKLNAAQLMANLGIAKNRIYDELDILDPETVIDEFMQQQMDDAMFGNEIKLVASEADLEIARKQQDLQLQGKQKEMQMQMEAQQAQMQQQQAQMQQKPMGGGGEMPPGMQAEPGATQEQAMQYSQGGAPTTPEQAMQQALLKAGAGLSPEDQLNSFGAMTQAAQKETGFNPAMGGTPPAMLSPELTRETIKGRTRGGEPTR